MEQQWRLLAAGAADVHARKRGTSELLRHQYALLESETEVYACIACHLLGDAAQTQKCHNCTSALGRGLAWPHQECQTGQEYTCAVCDLPFCSVCSAARACPQCEIHQRMCDHCWANFSFSCIGCGAVMCETHAETCAACGSPVCGHCREACAECEQEVCSTCMTTCDHCHGQVCRMCVERCTVCHDEFCARHINNCACDICGESACPGCSTACADCGADHACMWHSECPHNL